MTMFFHHNGTLDPRNSLPHGSMEGLAKRVDLSETQIDEINEAIEEWAVADPDGYSEHHARQLHYDIERIAGLL